MFHINFDNLSNAQQGFLYLIAGFILLFIALEDVTLVQQILKILIIILGIKFLIRGFKQISESKK